MRDIGAFVAAIPLLSLACANVTITPNEGGAGGSGSGASSYGGEFATTGVTQTSVTSTNTSGSTSSGVPEEPRLPPCVVGQVDDFEDVTASIERWSAPPSVSFPDGTVELDGVELLATADAKVPFEACRISLRLISIDEDSQGALHCHLDPALDPDHNYIDILFTSAGPKGKFQSGVSQVPSFSSDVAPLGRILAVLFEEGRVRVLASNEDETDWNVLLDEPRPAALDLPFSPCVLTMSGGRVRVDDVNVIPPALNALSPRL